MAVITNMPLIPVDTISGFHVRPGNHLIQGATAMPNAVNFTISSANATSCELLLFHRKEKIPYAVIPIPDSYRIGDVFSIVVFGLDITEFEYAYRMDGPYQPKKGLLFNKERILLDPYARAVSGQREWGENAANDHQYHARVVTESFDWGDMRSPELPLRDLIIYELHVRGFTRSSTSGVAHPGTFAGILEKLPHLLELGINAVELMPVFEFNELEDARVIDGKTLYNYWGYNTVNFFSPNTSYSAEQEYNREGNELKQLIRVLHENGIEVILDVVFNHTAEGNEQGSAFSFKGIDNNVYYMLTPDGSYFNFSGCGNTFNCNHPVVQQFILNCLRYWATEYRIDGFRFDLAAIMGRNEDGSPMRNPPLLRNLAYDPVLSKVKLIAEAWDAGGLYQVGSFSSLRRWAEWNGRYRDDLRCFLKGDTGMAQAAINRITGSTDLYDPVYRGDNASVNFLTCHDGFTLYDLYAYNTKHNEANGWNNTDGDNCGNSWNCGAEGETDSQEIRDLRMRLIKNAFATLLCSRGAAMFLAGDEFCNTQFGNNNPYCQDNEISWLDWSLLEKNQEIFQFCRYMIALRKAHPCITENLEPASTNFPSVSIHNAFPWHTDCHPDTRVIGILFSGKHPETGADDIVFLGINAFWETQKIQMPDLPEHLYWHIACNTSLPHTDPPIYQTQSSWEGCTGIWAGPRSVIVAYARVKGT